MNEVYVSITGLKLKSFWYTPLFYFFAVPSFEQARKAKGNKQTQTTTRNGFHHTLTVWDSKKSMLNYLYTGSHKRAIANFRWMATGKTYGYVSVSVPNWDEAIKVWDKHGRDY